MPSRIVRARLDEASRLALSVLVNEGRTESEAIRAALIEAAERRRQPEALAEEARRLAADPKDRAEPQAILADFESIEPDWPE
jgi:Arc/MetJ-type ribon-helix-helix transcriptional regulator